MSDLSKLSDDQLREMYTDHHLSEGKMPDLGHLSDADLMKVASAHGLGPQPEGPPSQLESFGRGAGQGATLGFQDEGSGLLEAGLGAGHSLLTGQNNFGDQGHLAGFENFIDNYQRARDTNRGQNDAAEKENPLTYFGGQVAGGLPLGIATGGGTIAPKALGPALINSAKLGAGYGAVAGLGNSQSDLTQGDVGGAAKDTALSAGLGALTGPAAELGFRGAGLGLQGAGKLYDKASPVAVNAFSKLRGISPQTTRLYANPETRSAVDAIASSFDDLHEGQLVNAQKVAEDIMGKRSQFVKDRTGNIQNILKQSEAENTPISLDSLLETIEKEKSGLLPVGSANKKAISGLEGMKEDLLGLASQNMEPPAESRFTTYIGGGNQESPQLNGFVKNAMQEGETKTRYVGPMGGSPAEQSIYTPQGKPKNWGSVSYDDTGYKSPWPVAGDLKPTTEIGPKPFVTPSQLNRLRQTFNDEAKAAYTGNVGQRLPGAQSMASLGNMTREELDKISPEIRSENARLSDLFDVEGSLKNAGLNKEDIDPAKLMNLLTAGPKRSAVEGPAISQLDRMLGTNLGQQRELARASHELNPEGVFGKFLTGYSATPAAAGLAASAAGMGPLGAAAGLGIGAIQSPLLTKPIIRTASMADRAVQAIRQNSAAWGPAGRKILDAAERGPAELAAAHFVLSETDSDYRQKLKEHASSESGTEQQQ